MQNKLLPILILCMFILSCGNNKKEETTKVEKAGSDSLKTHLQKQYEFLNVQVESKKDSIKIFPRTYRSNEVILVGTYDWTSGFYPGALWNLYGLTKNDKWKDRAIEYTEMLDTIQYWEGNHDVGFIIECSYGNALKYVDSKAYEKVIVQTAKSLSTRFRPKAGILQSWEWNDAWDSPVIIDNMMNLEVLFHATKISGDSTFYNIAVSHANTTLKNHFRKDGSSYHVVDYNPETGEVNEKVTHQGLADESSWARGQAWGLYGYTMSYRETGDMNFLKHAVKIAEYIINHENMTKDLIPYWDFDAPANENTPRDTSAAALISSALFELSQFVEGDKRERYKHWANAILSSLKSDKYLAGIGSNGGFLLKHSVGNKPGNSEVNAPLNYTDYYFLEALMRSESQKD